MNYATVNRGKGKYSNSGMKYCVGNISWVPEDFCIKRIRVKLSGKDKSPFILETIDNNYFNNPTSQQNDETYIS